MRTIALTNVILLISFSGCTHSVGLSMGDTDKGTDVGRASASPTVREFARSQGDRSAAILVVRAENTDSQTAFELQPMRADTRREFEHKLAGTSIGGVGFVDPQSSPKPSPEELSRLAARRGARLLLVYSQETRQTASGSLVYKVVYNSRARGVVLDAKTREKLFTVDADCEGTLGGLTPLQTVVHPHVEFETERITVGKLADAVRQTLEKAGSQTTSSAARK